MQSVKHISLLLSLILTATACGQKEVRTAAESMNKYKAVRILTDAVNAPFEFGSGTGVQGLDIDLGNEIGKALGYEVKWIKVSGYDRLFELLKNGEAEIVISAVAIDPQRIAEFAFSKPYYDSGDVIAHRRTEINAIRDLSGLSGKKVGVAAGRSGDKLMAAQTTAAKITITKYPTLDDALGALNHNEIDAVVGDEPMMIYSCFKSYKNTTASQNLIQNYKYAAVVRKDENQLLAKINDAIDRMMASGELKRSEEQFFGSVREELINQTEGDRKIEAARKAPKTIFVNLTKLSGAWDMDRLDGFVLVLNGPAGQFQSTPILTDGSKGHCKFITAIPPGNYQLKMSVLKNPIEVPVPEQEKSSLTLEISMGIKTTIQFR